MSLVLSYSAEELEAIAEMAGHGFTKEQIAEVVKPTQKQACMWDLENNSAPPGQYLRKGFLEAELALRQRIMLDAKAGSSPAQALMKRILLEAELKNSIPPNSVTHD